jgi:hypothetical protein
MGTEEVRRRPALIGDAIPRDRSRPLASHAEEAPATARRVWLLSLLLCQMVGNAKEAAAVATIRSLLRGARSRSTSARVDRISGMASLVSATKA